uniref:PROP1-like PPR domain-containing protein n=1 Tax=Alexandrium monilatum TaxID=311494 RepID=A0A7S4UTZ8_9DINO
MPPSSHCPGAAEGRSAQSSSLEDIMRRRGVMEAWDAFEEMQRQGLFVDRFTVSRMLIKTAGDSRTRWYASRVYRGLTLVEGFIQAHPQHADEVLFNALLDTCCRLKDISRLEATMKGMMELQVYPSHVTLGILVKAYGQAGDIARVLRVWEEMAEQRQQANAVTYGCMIDACVRCGSVQKAAEIFHEMKGQRRHRNTILYTMLIKGHGLEKNLQAALALFREMQEESVPCNTITYNSIIDACIKCSDMRTAEELMHKMLSPDSGVEPDLITFSTLLKGYCHVGNMTKALQVAETIKERDLRCDELVYNTLMDGCVKANDILTGIGVFTEMTGMGLRPSSITHSILVRLYQRHGHKGTAYEAVAQLYEHHGLQRPAAISERGSRAHGGAGRRGERQRGQRGGVGQGGRGGDASRRQPHPLQAEPQQEPVQGYGLPQPVPPGPWAGSEAAPPMAGGPMPYAAMPRAGLPQGMLGTAPAPLHATAAGGAGADVLAGLYAGAHEELHPGALHPGQTWEGPAGSPLQQLHAYPAAAPHTVSSTAGMIGPARLVPAGRARRGSPPVAGADQWQPSQQWQQLQWQEPQWQGPQLRPPGEGHQSEELERELEHRLGRNLQGGALWPSTDDETPDNAS